MVGRLVRVLRQIPTLEDLWARGVRRSSGSQRLTWQDRFANPTFEVLGEAARRSSGSQRLNRQDRFADPTLPGLSARGVG